MGAGIKESLKPRFEAYAQAKFTTRAIAGSKELKVVCWLFNQGSATADNVIAILQKRPPSALFGWNHKNWDFHLSAYQGEGMKLKNPLNPGDRVTLFSFNLGMMMGDKYPAPIVNDELAIGFKVLARDQPCTDFHISLNQSEVINCINKQFTSSKS